MATTIKHIMEKKVATINENESIEKVCRILVSKKLSGIPVVGKHDQLTGFISERDIIKAVGDGRCSEKMVSDVMRRDVFAMEEDSPAEQVAKVFTDKPYRYIPVIKKGRLVGIVSRRDMINKLMGQYY